jgi:hypothetical protein
MRRPARQARRHSANLALSLVRPSPAVVSPLAASQPHSRTHTNRPKLIVVNSIEERQPTQFISQPRVGSRRLYLVARSSRVQSGDVRAAAELRRHANPLALIRASARRRAGCRDQADHQININANLSLADEFRPLARRPCACVPRGLRRAERVLLFFSSAGATLTAARAR